LKIYLIYTYINMSKINYKKLYEESIFDKINLQKQIDEIKLKLNNTEKLIDTNNINFINQTQNLHAL